MKYKFARPVTFQQVRHRSDSFSPLETWWPHCNLKGGRKCRVINSGWPSNADFFLKFIGRKLGKIPQDSSTSLRVDVSILSLWSANNSSRKLYTMFAFRTQNLTRAVTKYNYYLLFYFCENHYKSHKLREECTFSLNLRIL